MQFNSATPNAVDKWTSWILDERFDGKRELIEALFPIRDKILENAEIADGETLLDLGTGDGLIGFGALPKVGRNGIVIFSDISQEALDYCKEFVTSIDAQSRAVFLQAEANDLSALSDSSVDVITTRSVLIYESKKREAFKEFRRVLRPRGRLSLFEPVAQIAQEFTKPNSYQGYDLTPVKDLFDRVSESFELQTTVTSPMTDFDDRDLVWLGLDSGFEMILVETTITSGNAYFMQRDWERFYHSSMKPNFPTLAQAAKQNLNAEEIKTFEDFFRPLVEEGKSQFTQVAAYVVARK